MNLFKLMDMAASTLHEGFLTKIFGDRGAVAVCLMVAAAFPDSLAFCFWAGLAFPWWIAATSIVATDFQILAARIVLVVLGVIGLWRNLRKMARKQSVRTANPPAHQ